jgi:tetratricopeptide (TPR) repeat protein
LVTAIRPRDYDIGAILRAAGAIKAGFQGFILRLLASDYFLDHGRVQEASEYVQEAGVIYDESASSEVSPELLTALVFGCAYLCRDATLTEQWWMQMSAKNPTRFNVDYWLAASAHQWMAGNLGDANECAEKAAELARDLPDFGAYEFDRYRCAVLLRAVREVSATA